METFVLDPSVHTTASVPRFARQFQKKQYRDKHFAGGESGWKKKLERSSTVYVGNLSCYTNEYQLYELFTRCGSIKRIIMGLDKNKKTPCGFCFVEFDERESALKSINFLSRTHLDGRAIQVDIDAGFEEGRQYGRGSHGGQVGDERRREREQGVSPHGQRSSFGGASGGSPILTRSITVVACIAMISMLLIADQPTLVTSSILEGPTRHSNQLGHNRNHRHQFGLYISPVNIKIAQTSQNRTEYENAFAQALVNIMKASKPSLLRAFIKATLADKQLRDISIGLFFNTTSTGDD